MISVTGITFTLPWLVVSVSTTSTYLNSLKHVGDSTMLTLFTNSERYSKLFERIGFRLGYVHITAPTHNEKTGMRTARMGTLEDAKNFAERSKSHDTKG